YSAVILFFLVFLTRRHPGSILFPYTTLFRSVYLGLSKLKSGQNPKKALLLITDGEDNHSHYSRGDIREVVRESDAQIYVLDLGRDRKSTRLNSSHVAISYAVFCLKKKTITAT